MTDQPKDNCGTCRFWFKDGSPDALAINEFINPNLYGHCRRRSPVRLSGGTGFPAIEDNGWCGEHDAPSSENLQAVLKALKRCADGWDNAVELGIIAPEHTTAATIMRDEARRALAGFDR